jgi:hypothetical protein
MIRAVFLLSGDTPVENKLVVVKSFDYPQKIS